MARFLDPFLARTLVIVAFDPSFGPLWLVVRGAYALLDLRLASFGSSHARYSRFWLVFGSILARRTLDTVDFTFRRLAPSDSSYNWYSR